MAHNKDDNPTANRPRFGPIPTGGDWNPTHGADPDVIDFHRYAAGEPEHIVLSSVDTLTRLNRILGAREETPMGSVRIPDDCEHRFQSNVNTDSGHVEQRFRDGEHGFRGT